jgi:hypothetical protein
MTLAWTSDAEKTKTHSAISFFTALPPSEDPEEECENDAYYNARCKRKVESEVPSLNEDVPGESAQPRYSVRKGQKNPDRGDHDAEHDEKLSDMLHSFRHIFTVFYFCFPVCQDFASRGRFRAYLSISE